MRNKRVGFGTGFAVLQLGLWQFFLPFALCESSGSTPTTLFCTTTFNSPHLPVAWERTARVPLCSVLFLFRARGLFIVTFRVTRAGGCSPAPGDVS